MKLHLLDFTKFFIEFLLHFPFIYSPRVRMIPFLFLVRPLNQYVWVESETRIILSKFLSFRCMEGVLNGSFFKEHPGSRNGILSRQNEMGLLDLTIK